MLVHLWVPLSWAAIWRKGKYLWLQSLASYSFHSLFLAFNPVGLFSFFFPLPLHLLSFHLIFTLFLYVFPQFSSLPVFPYHLPDISSSHSQFGGNVWQEPQHELLHMHVSVCSCVCLGACTGKTNHFPLTEKERHTHYHPLKTLEWHWISS